jgi:prevent-host-death family protein
MITVASKELKNRLGRYLALVRNGDTVQVTDRGRPVACLVPSGQEVPLRMRTLAKVIGKGGVRIGDGKPLPNRKIVALGPGRPIVEMVADQRR